jgi:hypothetical protein
VFGVPKPTSQTPSGIEGIESEILLGLPATITVLELTNPCPISRAQKHRSVGA